MGTINHSVKEVYPTQSTLLISRNLAKKRRFIRDLKGKKLTVYLNKLLKDPYLWDKLRRLKSKKWKKNYQRRGLNLNKVHFYPYEQDWAKLSAISNGTGFSRCFIFVYLMMIDLKLMSSKINGTKWKLPRKINELKSFAVIYLDKLKKLLTRKLII